MTLIDKKYREIKPNTDYLTDKVVLAQAWKKAHQAIRSTNWYADTFELDRSAIDLDARLDQWLKELESEGFSFGPLVLVPAPKAASWHFKEIKIPIISPNKILSTSFQWQPKLDSESSELNPLRPLAHVSIRDQSLLTALMMCLANKVETEQGDASTEFCDVHEKKVVNYGNRLYCRFDQGKADFGWGNNTTYSKYFTDYQRFLARPAHFGFEATQQSVNNEHVYEVHLDLEKFYDKVNRSTLIEKVRAFVDDGEDQIFDRLLNQFESWRWSSESSCLYSKVCSKNDELIPDGIPQGLVAGGFFANVYLLEFDRWLADLMGKNLVEGIKLVDYCRYVDDMRLILVVDQNKNKAEISADIKRIITDKLKPLGLSLNDKKTQVERYRRKKSGVSYKLKDIQSKVSGPLSINEVDEQLGHLESLMSLAESLQNKRHEADNYNPLALIEEPINDVREDTLLRFSANKIHTLLRQKRSFVAQELDEDGELIPGSWDFLQERMGRKFIACWSRDPSLVVLLKKGLEFFPDKRLLEPVISQLQLAARRDEKQRRIAEYCFCEIFRHAATIIHSKDRWASPVHANIEAFFESLQQLAVVFIAPDFCDNEYLKKQARFFLLVRNDSPLENASGDTNFNFIIKLMKGYRNLNGEITAPDFIANTLLAYQLGSDRQLVLRATNAFLVKLHKKNSQDNSSSLSRRDIENICRRLAIESASFFILLVTYAKEAKAKWFELASVKVLIQSAGINSTVIAGDLDGLNKQGDVPLLDIIKRTDNPFAHENALLKLLYGVLKKDGLEVFNEDIDLSNCKVACCDWKNIQRLDVELELKLVVSATPLFPIPVWVAKEHMPLYRVGMFIRGCLLGVVDWSSANLTQTVDPKYLGIKTSFYKRQLSMMHSPEAINGETAPMSGWVTDLLFHLLQWPGVKLREGGYDWPSSWDSDSLLSLIERRISYQKSFYCHASKVPAYIERVDLGWNKDKANLNVLMVQSLLPFKKDFKDHGMMLDTPIYRARHRRHVAAVAELLLHKVKSQDSVHDSQHNKRSTVDLIIWPELSVNNDDIDILMRLSDKTGAMIFTGLSFTHLPYVKGPNNLAKWIVPQKQGASRRFISRLQGKYNMMADEEGKIQPWRPYQLMIELIHPAFPNEKGFILTGSICYDATDIKLTADLKNKSNAYFVPALNKDVPTFDSMVDALYYHMYQPVVLVNTGEFGGSVAKAPYKERYDKVIAHVHGANQVSISSFEINMFDFRDIGKSLRSPKEIKAKPAG